MTSDERFREAIRDLAIELANADEVLERFNRMGDDDD